jgi:hypothetical protein
MPRAVSRALVGREASINQIPFLTQNCVMLALATLASVATSISHGHLSRFYAIGLVKGRVRGSLEPVTKYTDDGTPYTITPLGDYKDFLHVWKTLCDVSPSGATGVILQEPTPHKYNIFSVRFEEEDDRVVVVGAMWCTQALGRGLAVGCLREWLGSVSPGCALAYEGPGDEDGVWPVGDV